MIINCQNLNPVNLGTDNQVDFEYSSSTCQIYDIPLNASTTNGFTYGEIINSIFLFMIFISVVLMIFIFKTSGIKIKRVFK